MEYRWPARDRFLNRSDALERLDEWYRSDTQEPMAVYGRRRVGKSWLLRRFVDGKRAVVLVGEHLSGGALLARFSEQLAPLAGGLPLTIEDVPSLIRTLYLLARTEPLVAVVDEFPWMLPAGEGAADAVLSGVAAAMEDLRDDSQLRLILAGSSVGVMEGLFSVRNPMHGRLARLELRPLPFEDARLFFTDDDPQSEFERFAVAGGMPRYLSLLGGPASLRDAVIANVLSLDGPLSDEVRITLGQELRTPDTYFAILSQLATNPKTMADIAAGARLERNQTSSYLSSLIGLRLVTRKVPVGADPAVYRGSLYRLDDPFVRFWFRYRFEFHPQIEGGLDPAVLYDTDVAPTLAGHVSVEFEEWCRRWVRTAYGGVVSQVGSWWGNAVNEHRRNGLRSSEEIDVVGMARNRVTVVGEVKWTSKPMDVKVLADLRTFKLPALVQAGYRLSGDIRIVLISRSGFTDGLVAAAATDGGVDLVTARDALDASNSRPPSVV